jgi:hypothetical protein
METFKMKRAGSGVRTTFLVISMAAASGCGLAQLERARLSLHNLRAEQASIEADIDQLEDGMGSAAPSDRPLLAEEVDRLERDLAEQRFEIGFAKEAVELAAAKATRQGEVLDSIWWAVKVGLSAFGIVTGGTGVAGAVGLARRRKKAKAAA